MKINKNDINELLVSKDSDEMRAFLNNCLLWNPEDIDTIKKCVNEFSKVPGVFDKHDNGELDNNKNRYTNEYLIDLNTELTFNFSKERYLHALNVANYLEVSNLAKERKVQASRSNSIKEENEKKKKSIQKQEKKSSSIILLIIAVLILLIILGLIIKKN